MNINNKEFSEIFPLNPPQGGYSFREGFPIVQFQIANQAKLLDGASLRLNGEFTLFSPQDLPPTNDSGVASVDQETGIALNNRVGVPSCIHQITTSTMSNQTLETIRSYGRFLASSLPVTHSQPDFDTTLAQSNAANASRAYNGARASNVTTSFSIPLRTGLFTGGNLIPLGQNGLRGMNVQLELTADSSVISGYEHYSDTDMVSPPEYTAAKSGLIALTKYLAKYLKGKNIRVNSISPGGIKNNQPKSFLNEYQKSCINKGMLDPEDLSGVLHFLISDNSKYVNGQNIIVDDGWTL